MCKQLIVAAGDRRARVPHRRRRGGQRPQHVSQRLRLARGLSPATPSASRPRPASGPRRTTPPPRRAAIRTPARAPSAARTATSGATARASDLVCVTPNIRDQARADNAAAASRRNSVNVSRPFSSRRRAGRSERHQHQQRARADRPQAPERPHAEDLDGERRPATGSRWRTGRPDCQQAPGHVLPRPGPDLQARRPQPERQRELRPDRLGRLAPPMRKRQSKQGATINAIAGRTS